MLPASVILTNRLINSSEAKDNSKVKQLFWHKWESKREIWSWLIGVCSSFMTTQPWLNVFHVQWKRRLPYVIMSPQPGMNLYFCLSTSVCLSFYPRKNLHHIMFFLCFFSFLYPLHLLDSSATYAPSLDFVFHDTMLWHLTSWPHSQTAITTPQNPEWLAV